MNQSKNSLWDLAGRGEKKRLPERLHVDVAIVGAGITGLTAAVLLKERGKSIAVLEMRHAGAGETGNTTAHLTEAVDLRYHSIKKQFGPDAANVVAGTLRGAIAQIDAMVQRFGIDCEFRRLPGFLYTEKRNRVADLKSEVASAKDAGVSATWTAEVPLPFPIRGGIRFENQAQFHPLRYLSRLAASIENDIYEGVKVLRVTEGEPCLLETSEGEVTANSVFVATNAPLNDVLLHTRMAAYRSYAIAGPLRPIDGLFWDTADPYHYTRWQDGTAIFGGEDHKVGQEGDDPSAWSRLEEFVRERFSDFQVTHRWSGQIIEPADGLPYIGAASEKIFVSTGYAGQGMTFGTAGAMIVTDLLTGRTSQASALFSLSRVPPLAASKDLIQENSDFPKHIILDRLASRDVENLSAFDVKSGEGKIIRIEGNKVALHRDENGVLHALAPACTHMGCDVAWNTSERSWDCPCHGSRFSIDGDVLNGPASKALPKVIIGE